MTTMGYDRPIKDLVDALSATKHVTHTVSKKTSVSLHHNGGVHASHEDVLETWKSREASAHFDVDVNGAIAQYVKVDEIAWGVGNWEGNVETISIEMADAVGAPLWEISDVTQVNALRLAAWLFVHVIGQRPSSSNFFPHQHWTSTDCPGPYVMARFASFLSVVQANYDDMTAIPKPVPSPIPSPTPTPSISLSILRMCAREDPNKAQGQTTNSNQVIWVQRALVSEGLLSDSDKRWGRGAFGSMTVAAYTAWQHRLGYTGSNADGIPGQTSLSKLGAKYGFHVIA